MHTIQLKFFILASYINYTVKMTMYLAVHCSVFGGYDNNNAKGEIENNDGPSSMDHMDGDRRTKTPWVNSEWVLQNISVVRQYRESDTIVSPTI